MNLKRLPWLKAVFGAAALALTAVPAHADGLGFPRRVGNCPPPPCHREPLTVDTVPIPGQKPGEARPPAPPVDTPSVTDAVRPPDLAFGPLASGAGFGGTASVPAQGYIDGAMPLSQFRLRYDQSYNNNRPDRAEFFYAKCGCFRGAPQPFTDPDAAGPPLTERSVDYQDISAYVEWATSDRFSAFVEVPYRFLNPDINANTHGLGDMFVGGKYALVACPDQYLTVQVRAAIPTGDSQRGLGTDHYSIEPGLLYWRQVNENVSVFGEIRDWIPIDGSDFAGNILRYGVGTGYTISGNCDRYITPLAEVVGWTVLSGQSSDFAGNVFDANGDTIVNAKLGVRFGLSANSSVYMGYARALTGEVWYRDSFRFELRRTF